MDIATPYSGHDFYCDVAFPYVSQLRVEHDDDWVLAFLHTRPSWAHHVVVVPRKHIGSLTTVGPEDEESVRRLLQVVQELAGVVERRDGEAAVVTNLGRYQDSKHLHVHIHSGAATA
jgi:histidine triad (HIT) family protein